MTFDPSVLTDEELLAAVIVARGRGLVEPSAREQETARWLRAAEASRNEVATFNERAAAAGYIIAGKGLLVHRWDCGSIQRVVRDAEQFVESQVTDVAAGSSFYQPSLPRIVSDAEAREAASRGTARRRTCRTCAPDL